MEYTLRADSGETSISKPQAGVLRIESLSWIFILLISCWFPPLVSPSGFPRIFIDRFIHIYNMDAGQPQSPLPFPDFGYNFLQLRERRNQTLFRFQANQHSVPLVEDLPLLNFLEAQIMLPSEVEYHRAEYSYRYKKYASFVGVTSEDMETYAPQDYAYITNLFTLQHRNILLNFFLPKVTSQNLEPNLIFQTPNIFWCNPNMIRAIFGMPAYFFTCPLGPISAQDFTRRGNPLIGRWTMEPLSRPITIEGCVVGAKRTYRFSTQAGEVAYFMDMYRVNELQAYANIGMGFMYQPGWALMRMYIVDERIHLY